MFQTYQNVTVAPGDELWLDVAGVFIAVLDSNQSDFRLAFDDGPLFMAATGLKYRVDAFRRLRVQNPQAAELIVTLAVGYGDVTDSRANFSGVLGVAGTIDIGRVNSPVPIADATPVRVDIAGQTGTVTVSQAAPIDVGRVISPVPIADATPVRVDIAGQTGTVTVSQSAPFEMEPTRSHGVRTSPDVACPPGARTLLVGAAADRREVLLVNVGANTLRVGDGAVTGDRGLPLGAGGALTLTTTGAVHAFNAGIGPCDVSICEVID